MKYLFKNRDFKLQYVDPETGYGFIYSINGQCFILNPVEVAIWKIKKDFIDISMMRSLFSDVMAYPNAIYYIDNVIIGMQHVGIIAIVDNKKEFSFTEDKIKNNPLTHIYFYSTHDCNAKCYHCYLSNTGDKIDPLWRSDNNISKAEFVSFIESSLPLGLKHVKITGGEPLLRPDILEIIKEVRLLGINVALETNGFLVNEEIANSLADQQVNVSLSLDGGSETVHDTLRGQYGSFGRVTKAIRMLSDRSCDLTVIMAISKRNLGELENVIRVAHNYGCRKIKINPIVTIGKAVGLKDNNIILSTGDIREIIKNRSQLEERYDVKIIIQVPISFLSLSEIGNGNTGTCQFNNLIGILSDGSISFCGIGFEYPELVLGRIDNINFDLKKFWEESEVLSNVRKALSGNLEGVCGQCCLESFCKGGCRVFAYAGYRSLKGPNPWCQRAFDEGGFPHHYLKPN